MGEWKNTRFVNLFTRGPQFEFCRGLYFSDGIYSQILHKCLMSISNYRMFYIDSRNLTDQKLLRQSLLGKRGNVALHKLAGHEIHLKIEDVLDKIK